MTRKVLALFLRGALTVVLVVGGLVLLWVVVQRVSGLNRALFPTPTDVLAATRDGRSELWAAARTTLIGALGGFVVGNAAGVVLALVVARSVTASRFVLPVAIGIRVIPVIALAPLLTLVLGRGLATVVAVSSLLVFFPTLINTILGLRSVTQDQVDMLRMVDASPAQIFRRLRLPAALPSLFAAFQVAAPASVLGAMLAEWVASGNGLGYLILRSSFSFQVGLMWAAVIVATLIAVIAASVTAALGRRVAWWGASS